MKYYPCKLFEGCLVFDLTLPRPIGKYEFANLSDTGLDIVCGVSGCVRCAVPASPIFLRPESDSLIVRQCPSSPASEMPTFAVSQRELLTVKADCCSASRRILHRLHRFVKLFPPKRFTMRCRLETSPKTEQGFPHRFGYFFSLSGSFSFSCFTG